MAPHRSICLHVRKLGSRTEPTPFSEREAPHPKIKGKLATRPGPLNALPANPGVKGRLVGPRLTMQKNCLGASAIWRILNASPEMVGKSWESMAAESSNVGKPPCLRQRLRQFGLLQPAQILHRIDKSPCPKPTETGNWRWGYPLGHHVESMPPPSTQTHTHTHQHKDKPANTQTRKHKHRNQTDRQTHMRTGKLSEAQARLRGTSAELQSPAS